MCVLKHLLKNLYCNINASVYTMFINWRFLFVKTVTPGPIPMPPKKGLKFKKEISIANMFWILLIRSHNATISEMSLQSSSDSVVWKLFKPWPLGQYLGPKGFKIQQRTKRENIFKIFSMKLRILIAVLFQTNNLGYS